MSVKAGIFAVIFTGSLVTEEQQSRRDLYLLTMQVTSVCCLCLRDTVTATQTFYGFVFAQVMCCMMCTNEHMPICTFAHKGGTGKTESICSYRSKGMKTRKLHPRMCIQSFWPLRMVLQAKVDGL